MSAVLFNKKISKILKFTEKNNFLVAEVVIYYERNVYFLILRGDGCQQFMINWPNA